MAKFLKLIGFLVLAIALWQTASDTFTSETVGGGKYATEKAAILYQQDGASIAAPQLPYLPDAELAGMTGQSQLLSISRLQRFVVTEYIFSLKDWMDNLVQREAVLSLHREKLYDTTAYYRCQPVCEYYIFTLRRIII